MATCTAPQPSFTVPPTTATSVFQELEEAREELEEALSSRQRLEEHLRLRERELTALKGALKEEVANHDRELERVRLQCHSDMEQLRRSVEDISQVRALCLGFVSSHPPFAHHNKVLCPPPIPLCAPSLGEPGAISAAWCCVAPHVLGPPPGGLLWVVLNRAEPQHPQSIPGHSLSILRAGNPWAEPERP